MPAYRHRSTGHSFGKISGVAPAAKLAIYKVAFTSKTEPEAVVYTGDALAAIDAAITDGVDVINYSVSSSDTLNDPVDSAYMSGGIRRDLCGRLPQEMRGRARLP
jgi:hypothetical protein